MKTLLKDFHSEQCGATTVEYSVMLALIALVCIAAIIQVGGESLSFWTKSSDAISSSLENTVSTSVNN